MASVGKLAAKIKLRGRVAAAEPMRRHTSFRLGGPADLYLAPADPEDLAAALSVLAAEEVPVFLLGGGTNLLVADRGIRGAVVDLTGIRGIEAGPDEALDRMRWTFMGALSAAKSCSARASPQRGCTSLSMARSS